ncbi:MAG: hypothetical protein ACYC3I_23965, partial [Gemmataceae bacterium]
LLPLLALRAGDKKFCPLVLNQRRAVSQSSLSPTAANGLPRAEKIMSLLGKILAIVNILAVAGVLVLLAMNYNQRQKWQYAVFREDLTINGLPIDDKETDAQQLIAKERILPKTQQDIFKQAAPNTPVATQFAELDRVKGELTQLVQSAGDKKKQIATLARILMPMAETIEQCRRMLAYQTYLRDDKTFDALKARLLAAHKAATAKREGQNKPYEERFREALVATFSDPPGPLGEAFLDVMKADPKADPNKALEQSLDPQLTQLQGQFEQMFTNAKNGGEGARAGAPGQQRRAIARLLFNMVGVTQPAAEADAATDLANNPAYKRFFVVVGVQAAVEAIDEQANLLHNLAFETEVERQRERSQFAVEHGKMIDLVREKKIDVDQHNQLLAMKKKEQEAHEVLVDRRRQDVKFYEDQLAAERRKSAQHLEELRELSDRLFTARVRLRENSDDNQKLEKQIRALETGR